jgi:3-hydroxyacyl-CoA dehydrogenase
MSVQKVETAAVLGSGVMGSGIAALLAGAGVRTYLLDIVPEKLAQGGDRNAIANGNLKAALKARPAPFYSADDAKLITTGNLEDDLDKLAECDWVIEVVVENLEIKQRLMAEVSRRVKDTAIVSTNTSGIDVDAIVEGLPAGFRSRWLGTHFFNPPRYMKLLELIPGKDTDAAVTQRVADLGRNVFGKGIVFAKNTPNFIANRIGAYGMMYTVNRMLEDGLTIAQVDAILGKPLGRPKTAVYKTADLVGIDTLAHVAKNIHPAIPDDPQRDVYRVPGFIDKMIEAGRLGNKTRGGFYTKKNGDRFVLDHTTGEYVPLERPSFASVEAAKNIEDTAQRIQKILTEGEDEGAAFAWKATAATLAYSAGLIPEISDNLVEIDRGMCWGYNWELGPFATWDAIGVAESVERMEKDGLSVPGCVKKMLANGARTFYEQRDDGLYYYDLVGAGYKSVDRDPKRIWIPDMKRRADAVVDSNTGATLLDAGDGVLLVEFHTKMNSVDADIVTMLGTAVEKAEAEGWKGVVIGNHADAFSAGANLMLVFLHAQQKNWGELGQMISGFQAVNMRLKYSNVPVVAAVGGMALGGGCEIPMHCDRVVLAGEAYVGLVEVGVGLIPAAGGVKEMICKFQAGIPRDVVVSPLNLVQKPFQNIATAKVSTSGKEAIENGHLLPWQTRVVLNRDHIIQCAKQEVLGLHMAGYEPPERRKIKLAGGSAFGALVIGVDGFHKSGFATEYDVAIGRRLAKVITGGNIPENTAVDEQHVLDLEREAFLSLCGEEKTQARIQHMLKTNRPLRN